MVVEQGGRPIPIVHARLARVRVLGEVRVRVRVRVRVGVRGWGWG